MMMLRYRSRAVTSKQSKMADHTSLTSPTQDSTIPISPFLVSPRFLRNFFTKKNEFKPETLILSPTSVLSDTKPLFSLGNPIWYDNLVSPKSPKTFSGTKQNHLGVIESKDIGLAIIGSPNDEMLTKNISNELSTRIVMFGSHLRVQIPPFPLENPRKSPMYARGTSKSPPAFSKCDHKHRVPLGHNPKPGNIFEKLVLEECFCGVDKSSRMEKKNDSHKFLSICFYCKKKLGQSCDIYIYKGEKSFCSRACRSQEMVLDGVENSEFDDAC